MRLRMGFALCAAVAAVAGAAVERSEAAPRGKAKNEVTAWVRTKDGSNVEGAFAGGVIQLEADGQKRFLEARNILTIQMASPASSEETERITAGLAAVAGNDRAARDTAEAELTDIGLPTLSPLLAAYKDTDLHEPNPLYRLFGRILPGHADALDRTLDLVRLADGQALRGKVQISDLKVMVPDGKTVTFSSDTIRRLAFRRKTVDRVLEIQALRHCTPIAFLDSGVGLTKDSKVEETTQGFVRLSFDIDGWASDADGIKVPGPNYQTNLVDGFPFGALVGKVGASGSRWFAGKHSQKTGLTAGRLYFAVNDNGHWQNNIGGFRVKLHATDAYDLGEPQ